MNAKKLMDKYDLEELLKSNSSKIEKLIADASEKAKGNRVESSLAETPSHTTVQASSHTAVLALYFTNSSRRENKPILLNQFKFSAL